MTYDWDIIGHEPALARLEQEILTGNIAHASLFIGPAQTGKFRIARTFAAILQCPKGFCKVCKSCRGVFAGTHPDTVLFKDDGESLKIDAVREMIGKANLTAQSPYRIFAIENIERMPIEAQNSFLKTLEEPPGKALFLLTTSRVNEVLPTILSRVRQHYFSNVGEETLRQALLKQFGGHADIAEVINIAQGRPGLAIRLMGDPEALARQRAIYRTIERFLKTDQLVSKFLFAEELTGEKADPAELEFFFDAFTRYLRKLLFDYTEAGTAHPLYERFRLSELPDLFESLEKTRYFIGRNANKKLALENFLLQTEK